MFPGFKQLLQSFNAHSVKYLVVGGYAVSFHAQPRATKDLDLFIKADPSNAKQRMRRWRVLASRSRALPWMILPMRENLFALAVSR